MEQHLKQTLSIQLPTALATEVEKLAMELGRSTSWVVEEALIKTVSRIAFSGFRQCLNHRFVTTDIGLIEKDRPAQ